MLLLGAAGLAGAAVACRRGRERAAWESGPRLASGHPILRMPFPAGTVTLCQQGNLSPPGRTHFKPNNQYALDLSNTTIPSLPVVAAAPGRVVFVYSESDPADRHAGLGYGNQVKVEHGDGYFTMYAHLERVDVKEGDVLGNGAAIGTVGFTGAAGNRHLHFSLHQGPPGKLGVYESTPMEALVMTDVADWKDFRAASGRDVRDGLGSIWDGGLYGSENAPGEKPLLGPVPPELLARLSSGRAVLEQALADRRALEGISRGSRERGAEWSEGVLSPILARTPRHALGRYWRATAVLTPNHRTEEAEAMYLDLLASGPSEPTWESWLVAWCNNRLGTIALERGRSSEARARFETALLAATAQPERAFAVAALRGLGWDPDAGAR